MTIYKGIKVNNGQTVTGDYCRIDTDGRWIGQAGKAGYWESKVLPESVERIEEDERTRD